MQAQAQATWQLRLDSALHGGPSRPRPWQLSLWPREAHLLHCQGSPFSQLKELSHLKTPGCPDRLAGDPPLPRALLTSLNYAQASRALCMSCLPLPQHQAPQTLHPYLPKAHRRELSGGLSGHHLQS